MSVIEFILFPVSILVGLAIARLLEGLYIVSESKERYWVHTIWLCSKLGQVLLTIWTWRIGGSVGLAFGEHPTFLEMILTMATPGLIFLQAIALLGHTPKSTQNWEEHFYANRTRFFILNLMMISVTGYSAMRFGGVPVMPFFILFALSVLALVTDNRRVHGGIACVAVVVVTMGVGSTIVAAS